MTKISFPQMGSPISMEELTTRFMMLDQALSCNPPRRSYPLSTSSETLKDYCDRLLLPPVWNDDPTEQGLITLALIDIMRPQLDTRHFVLQDLLQFVPRTPALDVQTAVGEVSKRLCEEQKITASRFAVGSHLLGSLMTRSMLSAKVKTLAKVRAVTKPFLSSWSSRWES